MIGAIPEAVQTHAEVYGRPVRCVAFRDMLPEEMRYLPEVLRETTRRCAVFGLLRSYSGHGEAFSTEGLTALGRLSWRRQQSMSAGHRLANGLLLLGALVLLYPAFMKTG